MIVFVPIESLNWMPLPNGSFALALPVVYTMKHVYGNATVLYSAMPIRKRYLPDLNKLADYRQDDLSPTQNSFHAVKERHSLALLTTTCPG
jgi:hypothetical protein